MENEIESYSNVEEMVYVDIVLSDDGRKIFEFVNCVAICSILGIFGIAANIINIIIFYKQGFGNTVNIAFFGLGISDFFCLISLEWTCICMNPLMPVYDTSWVSVEVMYLSAGWPHICFCRITSYITVYITAERFLSIALPMKVKQIVTAKRTTIIICLIYILNIMTLIPEYATLYLGWRFVPSKNRTLLGIILTSSRVEVEGLCYVIHGLLSTTSFVGVVTFTAALVFKLRKTSKWRNELTSDHYKKRVSSSQKELKTVKMVVLIACVLIICYIPGAIISTTVFVVGQDLSIRGKDINICFAVWSIAFVFQYINSSVNIFLYYKMSTKYRQTFNDFLYKLFLREKIRLSGI